METGAGEIDVVEHCSVQVRVCEGRLRQDRVETRVGKVHAIEIGACHVRARVVGIAHLRAVEWVSFAAVIHSAVLVR